MILQNQVRCNRCGDEPFSAHQHDFKYCKCGAVAVDGGLAYLRRVGTFWDVTDMSYSLPDEIVKEARESFVMIHNIPKIINAILGVLKKHNRLTKPIKLASLKLDPDIWTAVEWAKDNGRNEFGAFLAVVRALKKNNRIILD